MRDANISRSKTFSPDLDKLDAMKLAAHLKREQGPNNWYNLLAKDFDFSFDYIIERHGSITIIDPTSRAALEWLYAHLPEDCPRWGKLGFAVESNFVGDILEGMARDGLLSEEEYVYAMNAEERDRMAGEDVDWAEYTLEDR
jgi:hypothetical protein